MPIVDRTTLYSYFETGDKPTQSQFQDLIDSKFNLAEDALARGWQTKFMRTEDVPINIWADSFSIPLGVSEVTNLRFLWALDPDGPQDVTVNFLLYYYSDIQNASYTVSTLSIFQTFFKHEVLQQQFILPGGANTAIIDEFMAVNLPLTHNNIQGLVVLLAVGDGEPESIFPQISFEFN